MGLNFRHRFVCSAFSTHYSIIPPFQYSIGVAQQKAWLKAPRVQGGL